MAAVQRGTAKEEAGENGANAAEAKAAAVTQAREAAAEVGAAEGERRAVALA